MIKSPSELDHYELLDVPREAPADEIERAYRMALATWEGGSLATYSLYNEREIELLRERIEHAFSVLSDVDARAAYDRRLGGSQPEEHELPLDLDLSFEEPPRPELLTASLELEESFEEDGASYDGARLRRNRLQRGVELEQIARITKVNPSYLRFIEDDHFENLPAPVYVRGFVSAYARCLGLDPVRVVTDYMERFEAARPSATPSLLSAPTSGRLAAGRRGRR
jgi:flagellar biosynthesis protein FlhG